MQTYPRCVIPHEPPKAILMMNEKMAGAQFDNVKFAASGRYRMNSASGKGSLLKQTLIAPPLLVRFSALLVLAGEFIPRRWWRMKANIFKLVTCNSKLEVMHEIDLPSLSLL